MSDGRDAEVEGEAGFELGLEAGAVGVDGALRGRELDLRLDGELDALDGDLFRLDVAADGVGDGLLECLSLCFVHAGDSLEAQSRGNLGPVGVLEAEEIDVPLVRAAG